MNSYHDYAINLEDWVNQEVYITFENGVTETLKVEKKENGSYKVGIFLYNSRGIFSTGLQMGHLHSTTRAILSKCPRKFKKR